MRFELPTGIEDLAAYVSSLVNMLGTRWSKRIDQLDSEQRGRRIFGRS